jgi:large subunit ribosomal protein L3
MGAERVTVRNLEIVQIDKDRNLLFIKGAVPGTSKSLLLLRRSKGKK